MVDNIKIFGRLLRVYAKMDLMWFLRDTKICLIYMLSDAVTSFAGMMGTFLLAQRFDGFGGMSQDEMLFMMGYAMLVNGLFGLFFYSNNAGNISRVIGRGQLDHVLIQPVPMALHFLTNGVAPVSGSSPFICGLALTGYAMGRLPMETDALWWLSLFGMAFLSLAVMVAWVYAVSSLAFWAPYAAEEIAGEVISMFSSLASYPLGGLAMGLRVLFCTAAPIGVMAWLPATILLQKESGILDASLLAGVTAFSVGIALCIFRKGLKHYARYASPRYTSFGR